MNKATIRFLFAAMLGVVCSSAQAATVTFAITNSDGTASSDLLRIYPITTPINVNGSWYIKGVPTRVQLVNGTNSAYLLQGNYAYTNTRPIIFAVPSGTNTYNAAALEISGGNVYIYNPVSEATVDTNTVTDIASSIIQSWTFPLSSVTNSGNLSLWASESPAELDAIAEDIASASARLDALETAQPSSNVQYAVTAGYATNAASATHATTADSATTADAATVATSADSASTATYATTAGTATNTSGTHSGTYYLTGSTNVFQVRNTNANTTPFWITPDDKLHGDGSLLTGVSATFEESVNGYYFEVLHSGSTAFGVRTNDGAMFGNALAVTNVQGSNVVGSTAADILQNSRISVLETSGVGGGGAAYAISNRVTTTVAGGSVALATIPVSTNQVKGARLLVIGRNSEGSNLVQVLNVGVAREDGDPVITSLSTGGGTDYSADIANLQSQIYGLGSTYATDAEVASTYATKAENVSSTNVLASNISGTYATKAENVSATNLIYSASSTYADTVKAAATNKVATDILATAAATYQPILTDPVTNNRSAPLVINSDLTVNGSLTVNTTNATSTVSNLVVGGTLTGAGVNTVSNAIYTASASYSDAAKLAATNKLATDILATAAATYATKAENTSSTNVLASNLAGTYATKAEQTSGTNLIYSAGTAYADTVKTAATNGLATAIASTYAPLSGWTTNASNLGVITLGQCGFTNITGNITVGAFAGLDPNKWQNAALVVTNGSADTVYKVTLAAGITLATNSFCIGQDVWVTNKSKVQIAFATGFGDTNAAAVRFPQK